MTDPTTWEYWGQNQAWLTRAGDVKNLHGQAFFPRTSVPPDYGDADHLDFPDVTADPVPIDDARQETSPDPTFANLYLHWTQEFTGDAYTGISIFQVNPRAREKSWELKHTRLVYAISPIPHAMPGWGEITFEVTWPYPTADHLRTFARIYNRTAFLNFGPMTAIPPPP